MTVARRYGFLILNLALHALHQALIVFSLVGWMFCETRLLNLIALSLILFSWYGLGPLIKKNDIGGYCLITDLQWWVREKLGLDSRSGGYTKYLADNLLKRDFDETRVDKWASAVILACAFASLTTNWLYGSCKVIAN